MVKHVRPISFMQIQVAGNGRKEKRWRSRGSNVSRTLTFVERHRYSGGSFRNLINFERWLDESTHYYQSQMFPVVCESVWRVFLLYCVSLMRGHPPTASEKLCRFRKLESFQQLGISASLGGGSFTPVSWIKRMMNFLKYPPKCFFLSSRKRNACVTTT